MTRNENFSADGPTPRILDTHYVGCNFRQPAPMDDVAGKRGVRLFPGDDTPRSFERCNLINCEVPPGSTVIDCNTAIVENDVPDGEDGVTIDGQRIARQHRVSVVYGRYLPDGTVEYKAQPERVRVTK